MLAGLFAAGRGGAPVNPQKTANFTYLARQ
jgi:hypothetical protein